VDKWDSRETPAEGSPQLTIVLGRRGRRIQRRVPDPSAPWGFPREAELALGL